MLRRRHVGRRWSQSREEMEDVWEWRPAQGKTARYADCFVLRPQHNAPRLHNGQVRQTVYVKQVAVGHLADALGFRYALFA